MNSIKRTDDGYVVNNRLFEWVLAGIVTAFGAGGVGVYATKPDALSLDRWTVEDAKASHVILAQGTTTVASKQEAILERVRRTESNFAVLGGPKDPLYPKVEALENKIDQVQRTVTQNGLVLRELSTTLKLMNRSLNR